jgi:hypothetical protein
LKSLAVAAVAGTEMAVKAAVAVVAALIRASQT